MQSEEQRLIDRLFQRLQQAEHSAGPRDTEAEKKIQEFIHQQPAAPYYMAQSILIQEAALNSLNQQVQHLKNAVDQLKSTQQPTRSGFLSRLFGGGRVHPLSQPQLQTPPSVYNGYPQSSQPSQGVSFMSGALQTAAGVAGGMVLGNLLTNMFHHSTPEQIVNIIDDPSMSGVGNTDPLMNQNFDASNMETFNNVSDHHFLDQHDALSNDTLGSDNFINDDDGFL